MFIRLPEDYVIPLVYKDSFKFNDTDVVKESLRSIGYTDEEDNNKRSVIENNTSRSNCLGEVDEEYIYSSLTTKEKIIFVNNFPRNEENKLGAKIFQHIDEEYINDNTKE